MLKKSRSLLDRSGSLFSRVLLRRATLIESSVRQYFKKTVDRHHLSCVLGPFRTMSNYLRSTYSRLTFWQVALATLVILFASFVLTGGFDVMKMLVELALLLHFVWYIWVVFGVFFTRGRSWLTGFHVLSLVWGMFEQVSPWGCPLTHLEQFLESKVAGTAFTGDAFVSLSRHAREP